MEVTSSSNSRVIFEGVFLKSFFLFDSDSWQTCGRYSPWCFSPFTLPTWPHSWSRGRSFTNSRAWMITVWPNLGPTNPCSSSARYLGATQTAHWPNTSRRCTRTWRSSTRAAWPKGSRRLSAGKSKLITLNYRFFVFLVAILVFREYPKILLFSSILNNFE